MFVSNQKKLHHKEKVTGSEDHHVMLSISEALISLVMAEGCESFSLKTDSITDSSVEVVSCPAKHGI